MLLPRNVPGFQTGGYPRSRYSNDAPQGGRTSHPTYGGPYPQPPMSPRVQPRMPMGYDTSHWQASQRPPAGLGPRSEHAQLRSVPPADFPLPPGVVHQQSQGLMTASWSSSQASIHHALWGSSSPPSANESYCPYNPGGFVGQQNPPPMTPSRSQLQGSAGDWNVIGGSYSHPGQSANGSYSSHPPAGFLCQENPRHMTAAPPPQGPAGVQPASGLYS
jgi:hypothetical protein